MKAKLKLKKDVILSLSNSQKTRGGNTNDVGISGWETLDKECITAAGTNVTDCACNTVAGCGTLISCSHPETAGCTVNPETSNCGATDHCSYACATEGYTNCDQCGPEIGPLLALQLMQLFDRPRPSGGNSISRGPIFSENLSSMNLKKQSH